MVADESELFSLHAQTHVMFLNTVDWKMIVIKNNRDFDWTLQVVNYLRCKINVNSGSSF